MWKIRVFYGMLIMVLSLFSTFSHAKIISALEIRYFYEKGKETDVEKKEEPRKWKEPPINEEYSWKCSGNWEVDNYILNVLIYNDVLANGKRYLLSEEDIGSEDRETIERAPDKDKIAVIIRKYKTHEVLTTCARQDINKKSNSEGDKDVKKRK